MKAPSSSQSGNSTPETRNCYGVVVQGDQATFRVWAPAQQKITLRILGDSENPRPSKTGLDGAPSSVVPLRTESRGELPLQRDGEDFVATATASPGDRYCYVLDDGLAVPDPVSRLLPEGVNGPTKIVDPAAFRWSDESWRGLELGNYVIYELHVGTFTPEGTFDAAIGKLEYLNQLGVTVVELMPVAAFPGQRDWGYDGVSPYSVQADYGGPSGLKRFVDAAHRLGLAVMLDVVYNHLGPEGNYLPKFGPYFTAQHKTPWGDAVNYDCSGSKHVRRYVIENAMYWIREYHIDGLRLDAAQTIRDDSAQHIVAEIRDNVQALAGELQRKVCITAETDENDPRYVRPRSQGGYGLDAIWSDDFHHAVHAFFTGERQGYYRDFGDPQQIAKALNEGCVFQGEHFKFWNAPRGASFADLPLPAHVVCLQNHDQVGNRAKGERLTALIPHGARKLAAAFLLLSPHTPLLFMGQEYDEPAPFQFFADFQDEGLKKAVSEGRRREFKDFDFEEVPDPEEPETFQRSKLTWADGPENREMLEWHRSLLRLRQRYVIVGERTAAADYADGVLTMQVPAQDPRLMVVGRLRPEGSLPNLDQAWREVLRSDDADFPTIVFVRA